MKRETHRYYEEKSLHHVFVRSRGGAIVFYALEDYILLFTLYSCLSRRYGISAKAFCIMPNHMHSAEIAASVQSFTRFHQQLEAIFTKEYNSARQRSGPLFDKPFGYAPKIIGKRVRETLSYIANNPVAGRITEKVEDYRWNLLAYRENRHPFSNKLRMSSASFRLRRAIKRIDAFYNSERHLSYNAQKMIFRDLAKEDRMQIADYVVHKYNFLDYNALEKYFGSLEKALATFNVTAGSEHDIPDDWDDYSVYERMASIAESNGLDLLSCNFDKLSNKQVNLLSSLFSRSGFTRKSISRFLHRPINRGGYPADYNDFRLSTTTIRAGQLKR